MGNNPIRYTDPNGGYINMSNEGVAQRSAFMKQQAQDRFNQQGRYSYEFLYPRYQDALQDLMRNYGVGNGTNSEMGEGTQNEPAFMKALYQLNNDYLGLGLAATVLSSGQDLVTNNSIINNQGVFLDLQDQNGTTAMMDGKKSELYALHYVDRQKQEDESFVSVNNQKHRDYINAWHEKKWAAMDKADAAKRAADKALKEKLKGGTDLYASLSGGPAQSGGGGDDPRYPGVKIVNVDSDRGHFDYRDLTIYVPSGMKDDYIQHEYGHYLQLLAMPFDCYKKCETQSVISGVKDWFRTIGIGDYVHRYFWFEVDANRSD